MSESESSETEVDIQDEMLAVDSSEIAADASVGVEVEKIDEDEAAEDLVKDEPIAAATDDVESSEDDQLDVDDATDDADTLDADSLEASSQDDESDLVDDIDPITLAASVADAESDYDEYDSEDLNYGDEEDVSSDEEELDNQEQEVFSSIDPSILAAADLEYDEESDEGTEEDDVEDRPDSMSSSDALALNIVNRFLLARGQEQLVMIFIMIADWCKLYLSPVMEVPDLIKRRDLSSKSPLAFLLPRGGAGSGNNFVGPTIKGILR